MKKISALLALWVLFFAGLALANTATLTSVTGAVQAQTGTAPARTLRVGDLVRQGDTVITGPASAAVLRFEDGQVSALTANSRMSITAYQYNPQTQSGNVLLSLITGGMRAITGLIGRRSPDKVGYRAATATVGIRGTDITIITDGGNVVVTVADGVISFQVGTGPVTVVTAGNAVSLTPAGIRSGPAAEIIAALPAALNVVVANVTQAINQLAAAITVALTPGSPRTQTGVPAVIDVQTRPAGGGSTPASCSAAGCSCPAGTFLTPQNTCSTTPP